MINEKEMDGTKTCTKCGERKPLDDFFNHKSTKDGKEPRCKTCRKKQLRAYRINNPEKEKARRNKYRESNAEKVREYQNKWLKENPDKARERQRRTVKKNHDKIKARAKSKRKSNALFATWAKHLSFADDVRENDAGFLEVRCTYCGLWTIPTHIEAQNRAGALNGWGQRGECKIYCNANCKKSCPSYRQVLKYKGQKETGSSREILPELRILALERDKHTCQDCGATSECAQLHVHHIKAAIEEPMESADLDNVVTLCKACHRNVHRKVGCTYSELRCEAAHTVKSYNWKSAEDEDRHNGKTFGRLRVVGRIYDESKKQRYFCVCDCGKLKIYDINKLKSGHTSSCGCIRKPTVEPGESFGQLVVARACQESEKPRPGSYYLCCCACGDDKIAHATDLLAGRVRSCGKQECRRKTFSLPKATKQPSQPQPGATRW